MSEIRTPLRPLARILQARSQGENPDLIERENRRARNEAIRAQDRVRAASRLWTMAVLFAVGFGVVGLRMAELAASEPQEPRAAAQGASIIGQRADIVDRHGRILATNMETHSLYAHPQDMVEPEKAARALAEIFPELDADELTEDFTGDRKFMWIRKKLSPEQKQAVHDIGEPGLLFGPRELRLYPNGSVASHILGGASFGREGVHSAEVIGVAGVEKHFDAALRDPARQGEPLRLSLDLTVQAAMEEVLYGGMRLLNAKGAAAVLMEAESGEIVAMASLPDFDPNNRPRPLTEGDQADSPLFNRAVQGLYELGSALKIFTTAQALELGLVTPTTIIDTSGPMRVSGYPIGEFDNKDFGEITVAEIIVGSSNRGTGRLALQIGAERQQDFLKSLGFFEPTSLEMVEAGGVRPQLPERWTELSAVTVSYGHGISTSPLHLAAAYASLLNGGTLVEPTLLKRDTRAVGPRVVSRDVSRASALMLRQVVTDGTASFGDVQGYHVGGKTGTADKPLTRGGGYYEDKVIATFASTFPAHDPEYVLVVSLDEPVETSGEEPRRTAGWTAVPVAAEITRRVAPLLGIRPTADPFKNPSLPSVTRAAN